MTRRRFVYDPVLKEMVEISLEASTEPRSAMIMPDIPDFVSPVDGKVVHGRRHLREHNKLHGVTNTADFTNTWQKQAAERAKAYTPGARYDSDNRKRAINEVLHKLERGRK